MKFQIGDTVRIVIHDRLSGREGTIIKKEVDCGEVFYMIQYENGSCSPFLYEYRFELIEKDNLSPIERKIKTLSKRFEERKSNVIR